MRKESFSVGVSFTLVSAFGISLVGLFGKLGGMEFSLESLIFWRFFAAFFICLVALWSVGSLNHPLLFENIKLHFIRAFFVLGAQYSFYYYIQKDTLLNGVVLLSLGPIFIPIIEFIVTRNPIGKSTWIGLVISFLGMLCILQPDAGLFSLLSLIGALAGLFQGCSQVVFGLSSKSEKTELSTLYMFFLCMILSLFPCLLSKTSFEPTQLKNATQIFIVFGLGAASVLNQLARAAAYQHGTPSRLATFLYFSIICAAILDWLVFDKAPNAISILGAILVITGGALKIYLRSVFLKKR